MDPLARFCHNPHCTARGHHGLGNIHVHGRKEQGNVLLPQGDVTPRERTAYER